MEVVIILIDQHPVVVAAPVKDRFLGLELQPGFIGLALNAVQSSGKRFETGTAAESQLVPGDRLKNTRGDLLSFVDAQLRLAAAALAMPGNDGMKVILGQAILAIQCSKSIHPLLAFRHAAGFLPGGILPHLLQLSKSCTERGVMQTASILKLSLDRTPLAIIRMNRELDNKTGSIHALNGSAKSAFLPALKCGASCGSNL